MIWVGGRAAQKTRPVECTTPRNDLLIHVSGLNSTTDTCHLLHHAILLPNLGSIFPV